MTRKSKRRGRNAYARVARVSNARLLLTFLAIFAFTCQSYLTQTHIHLRLASADVLFSGETGGKAPSQKDGFPLKQDPANCLICQQLAHAGAAVMPAEAALVSMALPFFGKIGFVETAQHFRAPSHIWQGRAPPTL